jgi:hypothetical protein
VSKLSVCVFVCVYLKILIHWIRLGSCGNLKKHLFVEKILNCGKFNNFHVLMNFKIDFK